MRPHLSLIARAVVAAALTTAAGGLVACGGSDDEGDPGAAKSAQTPATTPADDKRADAGSKRRSAAKDDGDAASGGSGSASGGASSGAAASPGDGDQDSASDREAGAGGGGEASVERVVTGMYADLAAGDAPGVCSALSSTAQGQIAQQVPGGSTVPSEDRTCAQSLSKFLEVASRSGILERLVGTTVRDVEITGDTATATVVIGGAPGDVSLLRERGRWVLGSPPSIGKG